jgi:hypothetical protein
VDGEAVYVQGASNEAALRGSREELEWNQETDPEMQVDVVTYRHEILSIRSPIIESAGEPKYRPPQIGTGIHRGLPRGYDIIGVAPEDRTAGRSS